MHNVVKLSNRLMAIPAVVALIVVGAVFFSRNFLDHRLQAMSLAVGLGLMIWGVRTFVLKDFSYSVKNNLGGKVVQFRLSDQKAQILGSIFFIGGLILFTWGLVFLIAILEATGVTHER